MESFKDNNNTGELATFSSSSHNESTTSHFEEPPSETSDPTDNLDNKFVVDSVSQSEEDDNGQNEDWKPEKNKEKEEHSNAAKSHYIGIRKHFKRRKPQPSLEKCTNSGCICKVCGVLFRSTAILTKHSVCHLDNQKAICGVCGQQLESSEELRKYLQIHQKFHYCETCGYFFLSFYSFQNHNNAHKIDKPFKCWLCGKIFSDKFLREHELSHNKIYKCDTCRPTGWKFRTRAHFDCHMRIHLGIKPFTCTVCGHKYGCKHHLDVHMRTHTGHKPYKCTQCDKAFSQSLFENPHELPPDRSAVTTRCPELKESKSINSFLNVVNMILPIPIYHFLNNVTF
ncbi:hypothetical protein NQD34_016899 [Periophthalmus magnuspinnatus]|nr:hypothetical protein NQD34_016899 [Periophthalmus magnuspinnatus]